MKRFQKFLLPLLTVTIASPLLVSAASPTTQPVAQAPAAPIDTSKAYVLHVPGIAGETQMDHRLVAGLKEAGFGGEAEIYDWTGEKKGIAALINHDQHDAQAQKIADKIIDHRKANPKGQIVLTAHSAGTGLVVFALEKLPKDITVDGVLLLAPALSPTYDLSDALKHVQGRAYCFSSTMDFFVLGLGTKVFGTVDRKKGESAGRVGFVKPEMPADPSQYEKLISCPYNQAWLRFGNIGDHMSVLSQAFTHYVLAPLIFSHLPGGGGPATRPFIPVGPMTLPANPDK